MDESSASEMCAIPSSKRRVVNVAYMALAATRLDRAEAQHRREGHKPDAGNLEDPEIQAYINGGYAAMRRGLTDGATASSPPAITAAAVCA